MNNAENTGFTPANNGFNVLDSLKDRSLEELRAISEADRLPFGLLCLNIEQDLNLATCVRSAHLLGAENVFMLGDHKMDRRGLVGAANYTNLHRIKCEPDSDSLIGGINNVCSEYGYTPVFMEYNEYSRPINDAGFGQYVKTIRPLIIAGNEGKGIPMAVMEAFGYKNIYHIQQRGVLRSLNVANAVAIMLHETMRFL